MKKRICHSILGRSSNAKRDLEHLVLAFACQSCPHISIKTQDDSPSRRLGYSVTASKKPERDLLGSNVRQCILSFSNVNTWEMLEAVLKSDPNES
jgi:hypothetical protein